MTNTSFVYFVVIIETINLVVYRETHERLLSRVARWRPAISRTSMVYHDNASRHTTPSVSNLSVKETITVVPHPTHD